MPGIESFGRQRGKSDDRSTWEAKLKGANFQWVRDLVLMFQMAENEAKARGGNYAFKTEHLDALRPFMANPCLQTAISLLEEEPSVWTLFERSKNPFRLEVPTEPTQFEIENAQHMLVIDSGLSSIKLGVFTRLSRRFRQTYDPQRTVSLAFCVTYSLFCEPIRQPTFAAFAKSNSDLIEREIRNAFRDDELSELILLAYAASMIALGWETRDPVNPVANRLTEMATDHNMEIPNIVQVWGAQAILTFFQRAQEFMISTLSA
jgi:hypothetical protein